MSQARERGKGAPAREELLEWIDERINELEVELKVLKAIKQLLEEPGGPLHGEKSEDVRVGKRRIARIYRGEDYVRLVFDYPTALPPEIREYLNGVEGELRSSQAKSGVESGELARLAIRERPDGTLAEIKFENLHSTIELLKVKAALKYSAEMTYHIDRARSRFSTD